MKADCLGSSSGMIASGEKQNLNHLYSQLNRLLEITESEEYDIHSRKYPLLEKKCEALIRNIRDYLAKATSKEEIEDIIKSDSLVFDLFHQAFMGMPLAKLPETMKKKKLKEDYFFV